MPVKLRPEATAGCIECGSLLPSLRALLLEEHP
jgi:hypothetical protein